jgi:shikimate dehydrogenase
VINTTSAGLEDDRLPLPANLLRPTLALARAAVEVIYGKITPFLHEAEQANLPSFDGSEMLLQQGILAFHHFTEQRFKLDAIEAAMRPFLRL